MTTRRAFLTGASSLLATPTLVRAASLDYVPRHFYRAYHDGTGVYDIVRNDGFVVGWLTPHELRQLPDRSVSTIIRHASEGMNENNRKLFQSLYEKDLDAKPMTLRQMAQVV